MWLAIGITLAAAAGNNIGKALQKQATKNLPRLTNRREVLMQYMRCGTWVVGLAADLGGALLMIAAFALAPVSIVQPVSSVGLLFLMLFSHFFLQERLGASEWVSAAAAGIGILGLGASSEPVETPAAAARAELPALRVLGCFAVLVGALAAQVWVRQRHAATQRLTAAAAGRDAALCGLEAGACFGLSAAACRTGFQLSAKLGWVLVPLGLAGSVMLTSTGFVLQTRGLKAGSTVVVCTLAAASSMLAGVLVGLLVLGEQLPGSRTLQALRLASWALILAGVVGLAGGGSALLCATLHALTRPLPQALRARLLRTVMPRAASASRGLAADDSGPGLPLSGEHVS